MAISVSKLIIPDCSIYRQRLPVKRQVYIPPERSKGMATQAIPTGVESDKPIVRHIIELTEREMTRHGYDVSIVEQCQPPEGSGLPVNSGITPAFLTDGSDVSEMIRNGVAFPFSIETEIDGYFGESSGSSNVTTFFVRDDMSIPEVIEKLHVTGQIEVAAQKIEAFCQDVEPINVVAFAIATYAKGWLAEMFLTQHDRFSKGSVSQDKGGLDVYDNEIGDWRQVKCVTKDSRVSGWLYYQFDMRGNIHFGDDLNDVNKSAVRVANEVPLTPAYKTQNPAKYQMDRKFRFLWW